MDIKCHDCGKLLAKLDETTNIVEVTETLWGDPDVLTNGSALKNHEWKCKECYDS